VVGLLGGLGVHVGSNPGPLLLQPCRAGMEGRRSDGGGAIHSRGVCLRQGEGQCLLYRSSLSEENTKCAVRAHPGPRCLQRTCSRPGAYLAPTPCQPSGTRSHAQTSLQGDELRPPLSPKSWPAQKQCH